jgi:hypothetical protein
MFLVKVEDAQHLLECASSESRVAVEEKDVIVCLVKLEYRAVARFDEAEITIIVRVRNTDDAFGELENARLYESGIRALIIHQQKVMNRQVDIVDNALDARKQR